MDARAFFDLTAQMRDAQRAYFDTPHVAYRQKQEYLQLSRRLEAQVDAEIKRVREIIDRRKWEEQNPTFPGFE